jgi:hypothetical protein
MGVVYEVEHVHTGAHLALKVLSDRALGNDVAVQRFRREARVPARIQSSHVVHVIDADVASELGGVPFLVMELLDGQDLERLCGGAPQLVDSVVEWLRQAARGLDKAHSLGIVHRDLKPANLFLARSEDDTKIIKVLDFGMAKMALEEGPITSTSEILGTPLFMAPEQVDLGGGSITPRTDLFALGLIAYKLLTGRNYWTTSVLLPLAREICVLPMPPPSARGSTFGSAFDAWFARACHRDPDGRFDTAGAQIAALASALNEAAIDNAVALSAPVASTKTASVRGARHAGRFAIGTAAVAIGTAAAAAVFWSHSSQRIPAPSVAEAADPSASSRDAVGTAEQFSALIRDTPVLESCDAAPASGSATSREYAPRVPDARAVKSIAHRAAASATPSAPLMNSRPVAPPDPFGDQH